MGKSKKSPTQTTTNVPFAGQQPFLLDTFNQARNLFNRGPERFFPGSTVANNNFNISQGEQRLRDRSRFGSPTTNAGSQFIQDKLQNNPEFAGSQSFLGQGPSFQALSQQAGAGGAPTLDQATQQFTSQLSGIDPQTQATLGATARGESLTGNPFLDETYDRAAGRLEKSFTDVISPQIAGMFSQAGRTGSDAALRAQFDAAETTGDALGNLATQVYGQNYQRERDRQLTAANQLGAFGQQQQGLGLQAAGQGADLFSTGQGQDIQRTGIGANLFNQDQARALQAAGIDAGVFGQQLGQQTAALNQAVPFAQQQLSDIDLQRFVGNQQRARQQQQIDAQRERFDFQQQAPRRALADYIAAIQGNFGGTTTSSQQNPKGSALGGALGGALTGFGVGGPTGALIGGLGGLLL